VKKILSALVAVAFVSIASAAAPPDTIPLPSKEGNVAFNHKAHMKAGCKNCHGEGKPGKIELNKDKAHKLCIDCHKEKKVAVQDEKNCAACHKK